MVTNAYLQMATPIVWADSFDYNSAGSGYVRTAQIDLSGLSAGDARQGDKVDLGLTLGLAYAVHVGIEYDIQPAAGIVVDFYCGWSASATAGVGNSGGLSGADGAYKATEEAEWVNQLTRIGNLIATADAAGTVQRSLVGVIQATERYIMPVVFNNSLYDLDADSAEMYIALVPIIGTDS